MPFIGIGLSALAGKLFTVKVGLAILKGAAISTATYFAEKGLRALLSDDPPPTRVPTRTVTAAITPARWIVGRARTGGQLVFYDVVRREARFIIILSEGACDAIESMWVDGEPVALARTANADGDILRPVAGSRYAGAIEVHEWLRADGTQGVAFRNTVLSDAGDYEFGEPDGSGDPYGYDSGYHDPLLESGHSFIWHGTPNERTTVRRRSDLSGIIEPYALADEPSTPWTTEHRLNGVSAVGVKVIQPDYGEDANKRLFDTVPDLQFLVRGAKLTWPGQATPTWTRNAAAIRYWWLTERRGIPSSRIDDASVRAAVELCDQTVTLSGVPASYMDQGFSPSHMRYALDGAIGADDSVAATEEQMDLAWAGEVVESGGRLHFRPGAPRSAVQSIGDGDVIAPPALKPWLPIQERLNAVTGELAQSSVHEWGEFTLPLFVDTHSEQRDGERRSSTFEYRFISDPLAAGRLQAIALRQLRQSLSMTVLLKPGSSLERLSLSPTDIVNFTSSEFGFNSKAFVVDAITLDPVELTVELLLREYSAATYDDTLTLPPLKERPVRFPTALEQELAVQNFAIDEIATMQTDGTLIVELIATWMAQLGLATELDFRLQGATDWIRVDSAGASANLGPVAAGAIYEARARHLTRTGVRGSWSAILTRTIGGDLMPPDPPATISAISLSRGFRATWTQPADFANTSSDFAYTEIHVRQLGADYSIGATDAQIRALVSSTAPEFGAALGTTYGTALDSRLAAGVETAVMARNVDRSGNQSALVGPVKVTPTILATDANSVFTGHGSPDADLGEDGDLYVQASGTLWRKDSGVWVDTGTDFTGQPGSRIWAVTGDASMTIDGEVFALEGTAPNDRPPASLGAVGDFAIEIGAGHQVQPDGSATGMNGRYWQKLDGSGWTLAGDLTGPQGPAGLAGSGFLTGTGDPDNALGKDGDSYLDSEGFVWQKANGAWTRTNTDLTGLPGAEILRVTADPSLASSTVMLLLGNAPSAGLGKDGDLAVEIGASEGQNGRYWHKENGLWRFGGDLTGPQGAPGIGEQGAQGPRGPDGPPGPP